ncbi:MAG TPA: cellulose biosynthesis cyclic di-GMP-binding regulatory protein BcsB, partial [Acetobacteraceae bacterium]|nr:cellulose biosynthesis cyclic di-GMP-binding regulatory protein BcsB [Acetobacteraceae bacterium]
MQCGDDFWNASFFCGSCAVLRRSALEAIGGFAVETVTEDAHTALRLHRAGWSSAYLRLPLAAGLATERLILHIGQRIRWARGMLQILRIDNPLLGPGLTLAQRLCYLNAAAHFLFAIPRVIFLLAPLAFLLLGRNIIAASPLAILAYAGPHIVHAVGTNARIQRNWRHSFWSEIYETVLALFLVRVTLATLVNPRRGRFNVTEKGGLLSNGYFDMRAVYPNLILAGLLLLGLLRGLYGLFLQQTTTLGFQALLLNSIWVTFSLLIVMAALAVGREARQARARHRVNARLPATLWLPDGRVIRGETRNLSLGGASLAADCADAMPEGARLEVEFSPGGGPALLPAKVRRWSDGMLQLAWQPASIADESRIVSVVFGRADAWLGWSDYPSDRPLRSLWLVLVSIRGLFRPRGEPVTAAEAAAEAAQQAPAGTLASQSLVVRPRNAAIGRRAAAALALALLLPAAAQAQAPSPDAAGMTVRPIPPPAPLMPPLPPSLVGPLPAAPAAADTGIGTRLSRVVTPLSALGAAGPMTMRGTSPLQGVLFGVPSNEVVTAAALTLSGAMSPALIPAFSNVTVTLNEQYVGTIPVNPEQPRFGPLVLPVNPAFFQDGNRLNFRFAGRYTRDCNDPLSPLLWATVSDTSTLSLTLAELPAHRDLADLPRPFFQPQVGRALTLPFVLAPD